MPRHAWLRLPRVYVADPLGAGCAIILDGKHHHYLSYVRRLKKGDTLLLFNGRDGEWLARLSTSNRSSLQLLCLEQTRQQPYTAALRLVFAPIKREHQEYMIEKATELGVSDFFPIQSDHGQINSFNTARLLLIATEAAQQSERLDIPQFHPATSVAEALALQTQDNFHLIVCTEKGQSAPIYSALQLLKLTKIGVAVGPEGGWSDAEIAMFQHYPSISTVTLGNRVLRSDTAAIAALSICSSLNST